VELMDILEVGETFDPSSSTRVRTTNITYRVNPKTFRPTHCS
jgi:hypothetical protein